MLTEERHSIILEQVKQNKSVTLTELCELLGASESTIRRDLTTLDERGLIKKVHGGAISTDDRSLNLVEHDVESKSKLFTEEKIAIARYAASLVDDGDFVYIDAGTTTEKMIDFLPDKKVTFVTNAFVHAKKLAQRGFKVYIPAGEIKVATEAIVGAECVSSLQGYNFTKSFIGANGISLSAGITTPDRNEASVKSAAVQNSKTIYVLADHSKFNQIASVTFAQLGWVKIITDKLQDKKYHTKANIKEVM
ncbi:MAG: DeoR/GlpR family DNA-binding transcription regulator [Clostridia bacterium]|nr:DeoR/GlpR family DNA-binding transcription regulator [Clostridia bacterium]MCQ2472503.1 DeoR/GlpR family DNA-binding transcription regulator [Clostridia bacterium]